MKPEIVVTNPFLPAVMAELAEHSIVTSEFSAAGLDVFADKPNVLMAPLGRDNVGLTPHGASAMIDNLLAHFAGRPL